MISPGRRRVMNVLDAVGILGLWGVCLGAIAVSLTIVLVGVGMFVGAMAIEALLS